MRNSLLPRQLQAGRSSLPQRRLESDAELVVATATVGGPFFFAAAKIRIGFGPRCCHGHCMRAILLCCYENWKRTRNTVETTNSAGETLHLFSSLHPEIKNHCTLDGVSGQKLASIRKFGPEIKNRCTNEGINGEKLASILKSGLEIKNRCTQEGLNVEKHASALDRQWRQKRVLMRPEAAFPYVFAAEGAQHPPNQPPRS